MWLASGGHACSWNACTPTGLACLVENLTQDPVHIVTTISAVLLGIMSLAHLDPLRMMRHHMTGLPPHTEKHGNLKPRMLLDSTARTARSDYENLILRI